jgi:hypothetical protein
MVFFAHHVGTANGDYGTMWTEKIAPDNEKIQTHDLKTVFRQKGINIPGQLFE